MTASELADRLVQRLYEHRAVSGAPGSEHRVDYGDGQ